MALKKRELIKLGFPSGKIVKKAKELAGKAREIDMKKAAIRNLLADLANNPARYVKDPFWGELAQMMVQLRRPKRESGSHRKYEPREKPAPWKQWGEDLEPESVRQLENACELPIAVRGALMPDAHLGYGLPIGGVLATDNAVIPFAVGVDIACRMKLTVLDLPAEELEKNRERLIRAIEEETRFGIGAEFKKREGRREHPVLDENWNITPIVRGLKDKAWAQLGTSGSGNHFVEFGILTLEKPDLGLEPGVYLALLSHSGSRGPGSHVAMYYSKLAQEKHPELPGHLRHLAWLDLDTEEGREYWESMELMGRFAAANHEVIHNSILRNLGAEALTQVENHHNFAWKEIHDGREVIVHRKGATPAAAGQLGIIPGSMASPAYVVRGKGNPESLNSASHGAGRVMSRRQAKKTLNWKKIKEMLDKKGITLLSAGLDEAPDVYKDIDKVISYQGDLIEVVAKFEPKIVKMAPAGERPED